MTGPSRIVRAEPDLRSTHGVDPEVVRVELLGGFRVSVGSRAAGEDGWRLRKARGLVALLALEPGHRMHRERPIDASLASGVPTLRQGGTYCLVGYGGCSRSPPPPSSPPR